MKQVSARFSIRLSWLQVLLLALLLWGVFGKPLQRLAGLLYPDGPAPWERIDLVFQADHAQSSQPVTLRDLQTLQECRNQAHQLARQHNDYGMETALWSCQVRQRAGNADDGSARLQLQ